MNPSHASELSDAARRQSRSDGDGILVEAERLVRDEFGDAVLATDAQGNSLTLLEEFARRKSRVGPLQIVFSFACAAVSIACAILLYLATT